MGKAGLAAAGVVTAGVAASSALGAFVPGPWAQGGALVLIGLGLIGASRWLEPRAAKPALSVREAPLAAPIQHAQEA